MNSYIPIELKGLDEKGLDEFKGKHILAVNCRNETPRTTRSTAFQVCWEGGNSWIVSRKNGENDCSTPPVVIEKKTTPDPGFDKIVVETGDFIFTDYLIGRIFDTGHMLECAVVLTVNSPSRLFFSMADEPELVSFWVSDLQHLNTEFNLTEFRWRESDEYYFPENSRKFTGELLQTLLVNRYPPGFGIGKNGIYGRKTPDGGFRIDIPANGRKPHETLNYPKKGDGQ